MLGSIFGELSKTIHKDKGKSIPSVAWAGKVHKYAYFLLPWSKKSHKTWGIRRSASTKSHKYAYLLLSWRTKYDKTGGIGKPACTKYHKYAYFLRPCCKKASKTGAFDTFLQKCPQNTCPAPCGTADGRGHIPIGPAPKLRKAKQNNT